MGAEKFNPSILGLLKTENSNQITQKFCKWGMWLQIAGDFTSTVNVVFTMTPLATIHFEPHKHWLVLACCKLTIWDDKNMEQE